MKDVYFLQSLEDWPSARKKVESIVESDWRWKFIDCANASEALAKFLISDREHCYFSLLIICISTWFRYIWNTSLQHTENILIRKLVRQLIFYTSLDFYVLFFVSSVVFISRNGYNTKILFIYFFYLFTAMKLASKLIL